MARKRANGEGTIIKRSDGRRSPYEVRFPVDGKLHTWAFPSDEAAKRKLRELQRNAELGVPALAGKQTTAQWLAEWLEQKHRERESNTHAAYEVDIRLHINPVIGKVPLAQLTPQQVQRMTAAVLDAGLSSSTASGAFGTLRNALNDACQLGMIVSNPCGRAKAPPKRRKATRVLDAEQVARLRAAVRGDRLEAFYVLALSTGMRRGELLGLRWSDVEWQDGHVYVERNMQRAPREAAGEGEPKTELVSKRVKTDRSRRHIPIPADVVDVLREHRRRQVEGRLAEGERWHDHDLVLCTRYGNPITHSSLQRHYTRTLVRAGVPYVRPHDLRHTFATLVLASGEMQPHEVAEILGHTSVNLVMNLYGHVIPGRKRKAATIMGRILSGQSSGEDASENRDAR